LGEQTSVLVDTLTVLLKGFRRDDENQTRKILGVEGHHGLRAKGDVLLHVPGFLYERVHVRRQQPEITVGFHLRSELNAKALNQCWHKHRGDRAG